MKAGKGYGIYCDPCDKSEEVKHASVQVLGSQELQIVESIPHTPTNKVSAVKRAS